tara:strand:- start:66 stop:278 length:213 start_codon:yes stop_codon:yes gene_type:complete
MANFWRITVEHTGDTYPFLEGEKQELIVQAPDSHDEEKVRKELLSVHDDWVSIEFEEIERPKWATAFMED